MRHIEPSPTYYNGVRYRSLTEARWAVFFDEIRVHHCYEARTFRLQTGDLYTPDFYIPEFQAFIEVKPDWQEIIVSESHKALSLAKELGSWVWLAAGSPNVDRQNILPLDLAPARALDIKDVIDEIGWYQILEDRRDVQVYWLWCAEHWYVIGGGGTITDHERNPGIGTRISHAYYTAARTVFGRASIKSRISNWS